MPETDLTSALARVPVIGILRGLGVEDTAQETRRLLDQGIRVIEVTIESLDQVPSLRAAGNICRARGALIGAGSVIGLDHHASAIACEADFTVAPGLSLDVVAASARAGIPHVPGVATASEITAAWNAGLRLVKAFPATQLGPDWVRAQRSPFPDLRVIATGGVHVDDLNTWMDAGCVAVGVSPRNLPSGWHATTQSERTAP